MKFLVIIVLCFTATLKVQSAENIDIKKVEMKVALADSAEVHLSRDEFTHIMSCLSGKSILRLFVDVIPENHLEPALQKKLVSAIFPSIDLKTNNGMLLPPLEVDEIIYIFKKKLPSKNIGIFRGEEAYSRNFVKKNNFKVILETSSVESLLKGMQINRVDGVIIKKKLIPPSFPLHDFESRTISYQPLSIELGDLFFKSIGNTSDKVLRNISKCQHSKNYIINLAVKEQIVSILSPFIAKIQRQLLVPRHQFDDVASLDKRWADDFAFRKSVLGNSLSGDLRKMLRGHDEIIEAFIFNHQGGLLASKISSSDFDQSDEEKYSQVQRGEQFAIGNISDLSFDLSTNLFLVGVTARLYDSNGQYTAGLYLGIDINKLLAL